MKRQRSMLQSSRESEETMKLDKEKLKKISPAIIVLVVLFIIIGFVISNQRENLKTDVITHEAGQQLELHAVEIFDIDETEAMEVAFDISGVNIEMVGTYEVVATYKGHEYKIKVNVVDTNVPSVTMATSYVFTNDIENANLMSMVDSIYDVSECSLKLVRFEKSADLQIMDENALNQLIQTIEWLSYEELLSIGTENVPTEEGIYRSVLAVTDAYGNTHYEEIYVIFDKTPAVMKEIEDKIAYASEEEIDDEPNLSIYGYGADDNVDGAIALENLKLEYELKDAEKHEWIANTTYTDRAGNVSTSNFSVTVMPGYEEDDGQAPESTPQDEEQVTTNQESEQEDIKYDPADENKDGVVDGEEAGRYISESEQKVIDAGYGNVVQLSDGNYAVLVHVSELEASKGADVLDSYLAERGLKAVSGYGAVISYENDWACWGTEDVMEIDTSGDDW